LILLNALVLHHLRAQVADLGKDIVDISAFDHGVISGQLVGYLWFSF
jgi:hypothetical protein